MERSPAQSDFEKHFLADAAAVAQALRSVGDEGAASLPLLPPEVLPPLLAEARDLNYRPARPEVGEIGAMVYQDFRLTTDLPPNSVLMKLSRAVERLINRALKTMRTPPFSGDFAVNDFIVQYYPRGCKGMSPHRDHLRYTGVVAIVILGGAGRFMLCEDRSGANAHKVPTRPGDLLLMRAPGFQARGDRPFHAVRDITEDRYILGLRHDSRLDDHGKPGKG
jgi:hypothetical protein